MFICSVISSKYLSYVYFVLLTDYLIIIVLLNFVLI